MISSGSGVAPAGGGLPIWASRDAKWTLVVPFKGGPNGKSRLQGNLGTDRLGPGLRREIALGFLRDTVTAAAAAANVAHIIVVSSDPATVMDAGKIQMLPDPGQGLNGAVKAGFAFARSLGVTPVAAITADLPCLEVRDLEYALEGAKHHSLGIVPDLDGTGSTMISALPGAPVNPCFGPHSRAGHQHAGHRLLPIPRSSTLRADVDTLEDLASAIERGVGAHTRAALLASGLFPARPVPLGGEHRQIRLLANPSVQRKSCPAF
ncbi:2-phospho-L-lactate guanylyltransferase [Arthrobacter globiformis]|uniref:Phosphoenolpyruvate guanylyltransferase n=1 Tax=Arthrobacter globiformis TaxID=1665 RepID=A0A328HFR5_ARTGO|nr:2-phospho-L-lactate guanylyltransferase [Arthrobacter globiformis]